MKTTTNPAATLLNILTAITLLAPFGVDVDEMDERDVQDAKNMWAVWFSGVGTSAVLYTADGRELRRW